MSSLQDKHYMVYICKNCGENCIRRKGIQPGDLYPCLKCNSNDMIVTDMLPSDATKEDKAGRWSCVLQSHFTDEEIEHMHDVRRSIRNSENTPEHDGPSGFDGHGTSEKQGSAKVTPQNSDYTPTCPTCHSPNIAKISSADRAGSIFLFGIFSSKINKQFECKNCGYKW